MRSGCHLLHHEERQSDESEAVAKLLHHDPNRRPHQTGGAEECEEKKDDEGEIEDQGECEEYLPKSIVTNVVASQDTSSDEGYRSERPIDETKVLICHPKSAEVDTCFQEQRRDLDSQALSEAVEKYKEQVKPDVLFLKETGEDLPHSL